MNTYIIYGTLALIGIFVLIRWNSKQNSTKLSNTVNNTELQNSENQ